MRIVADPHGSGTILIQHARLIVERCRANLEANVLVDDAEAGAGDGMAERRLQYIEIDGGIAYVETIVIDVLFHIAVVDVEIEIRQPCGGRSFRRHEAAVRLQLSLGHGQVDDVIALQQLNPRHHTGKQIEKNSISDQ